MQVLLDYQQRAVRLTNERLAHILEHPEMCGLEPALHEALANPERVVGSASDPAVRLYYRGQKQTAVGEKQLCVVVKILGMDAFVLTAYLTDRVKRGVTVWPSAE